MTSQSNRQAAVHPLLRFAKTRPLVRLSPVPPDGTYDREIGAWVHKPTGDLLITRPDHPQHATKKADIETGEDQKGT